MMTMRTVTLGGWDAVGFGVMDEYLPFGWSQSPVRLIKLVEVFDKKLRGQSGQGVLFPTWISTASAIPCHSSTTWVLIPDLDKFLHCTRRFPPRFLP